MKMALLVFTLSMILITACAQAPEPTEEPSIPEDPSAPTEVPADLTPAQLAAIAILSENLAVPVEDIKLVSTEAVDWPDGCLGVQQEGLGCTEVITPGFRIILEANGREVEYRTNEDGTQVRPATVLMTWKREGGIAGFCDFLTVYLSGEFHRGSCKGNEYTEERLRDVLSAAEIAQLNAWVKEYGTVNIDASNPKGVADRMVVILEFMGLGSQNTISSTEGKELLEFARALSQSLPSK